MLKGDWVLVNGSVVMVMCKQIVSVVALVFILALSGCSKEDQKAVSVSDDRIWVINYSSANQARITLPGYEGNNSGYFLDKALIELRRCREIQQVIPIAGRYGSFNQTNELIVLLKPSPVPAVTFPNVPK